jgi:hypothetical protein
LIGADPAAPSDTPIARTISQFSENRSPMRPPASAPIDLGRSQRALARPRDLLAPSFRFTARVLVATLRRQNAVLLAQSLQTPKRRIDGLAVHRHEIIWASASALASAVPSALPVPQAEPTGAPSGASAGQR